LPDRNFILRDGDVILVSATLEGSDNMKYRLRKANGLQFREQV
jgi:hypothetical protein